MRHLLVITLLWTIPGLAHADIARFQQVAPGILRGGQPMSAEDYDLLEQKGVRTILNLRHERSQITREQQVARERGMNFAAVPMLVFESPRNEDVLRALKIMTNTQLQPVFVHCQHGKDRTGMVVGLYRVLFEGWTKKQAYQEMTRIGFNPLLLPLAHYFWSTEIEAPAAWEAIDLD